MKTRLGFMVGGVAGFLILGWWVSAQSTPSAPARVMIVPPGAGTKTAMGEWKITGSQTNGALAIVEVHTAETRPGPLLHTHTHEDEAWYVIEGELTFESGGETTVCGPGTFVWAPRNIPHRYAVTKAPAKFLLMVSPAGLEGFFSEREELRKRVPQGTPEYEAEHRELQRKYGTENSPPSPKTP